MTSVRSLRVGIDGYNLALVNGTGVANYSHALAATLARGGHQVEGLFGIDAGHAGASRETLFFQEFGSPAVSEAARRRRAMRRRRVKALLPFLRVAAAPVPLTAGVDRAPLHDRLPPFSAISTAPDLFPLAMRHFRLFGRFLSVHLPVTPEIMHWTYPLPIHVPGARNIYTLHDLVPLRLPYATLDDKPSYRRLIAACIARAAHICTVSEASRADILAQFEADADRVTNTWQASPLPPGILERPTEEDAAAVRGVFGLEHRGYFLYMGAIEPKKNIGRLLEAYLSLSCRAPLVMVGSRSWQSERELALLKDADRPGSHLDGRVRQLSHLPRELVMKLVRGARAVLFPSLCEGFGLPVLEAMQLGTAVLTSSVSSLPEIAGGAALLVDPHDVGAIAAGIRALDEDARLRGELAAAGPIRARFFSEAAYLRRLESMYARIIAGQPKLAEPEPIT